MQLHFNTPEETFAEEGRSQSAILAISFHAKYQSEPDPIEPDRG